MVKDLGGIICDLFDVIFRNLLGETEKNHEKSVNSIIRRRFKLVIIRIQMYRVTNRTNPFRLHISAFSFLREREGEFTVGRKEKQRFCPNDQIITATSSSSPSTARRLVF
jgi:hypothetical protein